MLSLFTKSNCVRCDKEYELPNNPYAHLFSICQECHKERPEDINDQRNRTLNLFNKFKDNK